MSDEPKLTEAQSAALHAVGGGGTYADCDLTEVEHVVADMLAEVDAVAYAQGRRDGRVSAERLDARLLGEAELAARSEGFTRGWEKALAVRDVPSRRLDPAQPEGHPMTVQTTWDIGDPEPEGVTVVLDYTAPAEPYDSDSDRWGRTVDGNSWKGYKNGGGEYLGWDELVRRWGPVTAATYLPPAAPLVDADPPKDTP